MRSVGGVWAKPVKQRKPHHNQCAPQHSDGPVLNGYLAPRSEEYGGPGIDWEHLSGSERVALRHRKNFCAEILKAEPGQNQEPQPQYEPDRHPFQMIG